MNYIDAKGKNCPIPVVLAKKEIDAGIDSFLVEVDNETAVKNLEKLGQSQSFSTAVAQSGEIYRVSFRRAGGPVKPTAEPKGEWALFVTHDLIGGGSEELGASLMKMFFYTLSQSEDIPKSILFMNAGVKLPCLDEQIIEHLNALSEMGAEILVCGTCLNFYSLSDQLKVGAVSNMYDILTKLQDASKVLSL